MQPPPGPPARRRGDRIRRAGRRPTWTHAGLVLVLALTFGLRLWGIKQGLPFSYNSDEAQHFVPKAIQFFSGGWNPHYFLNPPGYSYLLAMVFELWFGSVDAAVRVYTSNPTDVYVLARLVCAVLGTLSVWLTYLAGGRLFRPAVGLAAAAVMGCAFLPVFYSHLALNDVPALFAVTLALYGVCGIWRDGARRDYLIAGAGIGLASGFKYTGGWTVVLLVVAAGFDAGRPRAASAAGRGAHALRWTGASLLLALACYSLANPYWFLDFAGFTHGVAQQASDTSGAAQPEKLGTSSGGGIRYYLWTFTWGLGWGPALAALAGALALLWRRRWWLAALFIPGPIAFIVFMGSQQRYFGRWLMPIFPLVAVLGAWAVVELIGRLRGRVPPPAVALAGLLAAAALLTQSLVAVIHNDLVLSRPYTTNLTRDWMVANIPAGQNVVIEPVIPGNWATDVGASLPWTPSGQRWYEYPTWRTTLRPDGRPLPRGQSRSILVDEYERVLGPALIGQYEQAAYCWVVVGSLQYGRAYAEPGDAAGALAYYHALARQGTLMYRASPYAPGSKPKPFNFDWSTDYYSPDYRLPGPEMDIYRLHGGRCS